MRGYEADGIFVVDGFLDTKLGFMCAPGIASDGLERCVPRDVLPLGPYADGSDSGPDYTDTACSTPLVTIPKTTCADPGRVLVRSSMGVGGVGPTYWRIGTPISPAKIYPSSFGRCSEQAPDPANDYFERGAEVPPTDLVAFTRHDADASPALRAIFVEGEDGSRLQADRAFIDVARNQPCEIGLADDGVSRCTPLSASLYQERVFADASCNVRAAISTLDCLRDLFRCDPSTVTEMVFGGTAGACVPNRHRFYAAGPQVASGDVYFGSGPQECTGPAKQTGTIVEVRAPIPPTAFPPSLPGSVDGHARLVERTVLVGGAPVRQAAVFDPQIDDECRFETAVDGKLRCLPAHALTPTNRFADAACTTPLFFADPCLPPPKHARVVERPGCDPVVRIVTLTRATRAFEPAFGGGCEEAPLSPELLVAADEVPPTTFVEATPTKR